MAASASSCPSQGAPTFAGEEAYDEERRRELEKALRGCEKLEQQRKTLLQKYSGDERVLRVLTAEP